MSTPRKKPKLEESQSEFQFPEEEVSEEQWDELESYASQLTQQSSTTKAAPTRHALPVQGIRPLATPESRPAAADGVAVAVGTSSSAASKPQATESFTASWRIKEIERQKLELLQLKEKVAKWEETIRVLRETVAKKDMDFEDIRRDYDRVLQQAQSERSLRMNAEKEVGKLKTELSFTSKELTSKRFLVPSSSQGNAKDHRSPAYQSQFFSSTTGTAASMKNREERSSQFPKFNNFNRDRPNEYEPGCSSAGGDSLWPPPKEATKAPVGTTKFALGVGPTLGRKTGPSLVAILKRDMDDCTRALSDFAISYESLGNTSPQESIGFGSNSDDHRRPVVSPFLLQLKVQIRDILADLEFAAGRLLEINSELDPSTHESQRFEFRPDVVEDFLLPLYSIFGLCETMCPLVTPQESRESSISTLGSFGMGAQGNSAATSIASDVDAPWRCGCSNFAVGALKILRCLIRYNPKLQHELLSNADEGNTVNSQPDSEPAYRTKGYRSSPEAIPGNNSLKGSAKSSSMSATTQPWRYQIVEKLFRLCSLWISLKHRRVGHLEEICEAVKVLRDIAWNVDPKHVHRFNAFMTPANIQFYLSSDCSASTLMAFVDLLSSLCKSPNFLSSTCRHLDNFCVWLLLFDIWMNSKESSSSVAKSRKFDQQIIRLMSSAIDINPTKVPFLVSEDCNCPYEVSSALVTYMHREKLRWDAGVDVGSMSNFSEAIELLYHLQILDDHHSSHASAVDSEMFDVIYWLSTIDSKKLNLGGAAKDLANKWNAALQSI